MTTPITPDPVTGSEFTSPSGKSPRQSASVINLVLVTFALLGGAAGTFAFLSAHPVASEAVGSPAGAPASSVPAEAPVAGSHIVPGSTHWSRENEHRWISNHKRSVAYELDADQQVRVWTTHVRPTLVVRCLNHKTEVFVFTETPAKLESTDGTHTVKLTFDDAAETDERWPDSEEHDALFAPDGTSLARRLASAHRLRFGFTPHNAAPVQVDFDLGDSAAVMSNVGRTCGWH
jgi:hypothetical protein